MSPKVSVKPDSRKRKRCEQEEDIEGEIAEPPRAAMTAAEKQRRYRKRKKLAEQEARSDLVRGDATTAGAATEDREPMPGSFPDSDKVQVSLSPGRVTAQVDPLTIHGR